MSRGYFPEVLRDDLAARNVWILSRSDAVVPRVPRDPDVEEAVLEPVHRGLAVGDYPGCDFGVDVLSHGETKVGFDGLRAVHQAIVNHAGVFLGHDHRHTGGVELRSTRTTAHLQQSAPLNLAVFALTRVLPRAPHHAQERGKVHAHRQRRRRAHHGDEPIPEQPLAQLPVGPIERRGVERHALRNHHFELTVLGSARGFAEGLALPFISHERVAARVPGFFCQLLRRGGRAVPAGAEHERGFALEVVEHDFVESLVESPLEHPIVLRGVVPENLGLEADRSILLAEVTDTVGGRGTEPAADVVEIGHRRGTSHEPDR